MLKAGVAQFTGSANHEENIAAVRRLAAKAAEAGVNLLCFPELANTVYVPFIEDRALFALAEPEDGESVTAARSIAREIHAFLNNSALPTYGPCNQERALFGLFKSPPFGIFSPRYFHGT